MKKTHYPVKNSFDHQISALDILQFFKKNLNGFILFMALGAILGGLYAKFKDPVYEGSIFIILAKIAGQELEPHDTILAKLNSKSYFSEETILACNSSNKILVDDKKNFIIITTHNSNIETINLCLDAINQDISKDQNKKLAILIEEKKNEIDFLEEHMNVYKKKSGMISFEKNNSDLGIIIDNLIRLRAELSSGQTSEVKKIMPIDIKRKKIPSVKFGIFLGIFFGFVLGLFLSVFKDK